MSAEGARRVACIGECMVELGLPPGGSGPARVGFAGDAANVAIYLKRCGGAAVEVAFVTAVGRDPLSDAMVAFLADEGLGTGLIERRDDRAPGLYAISLDASGERSFTYWREASAARTLFRPPAEVTLRRLHGFDMIYLSGISLAVLSPPVREDVRAFLAHFRAAGGTVAFDSNYRPQLWPDASTARREIGMMWALTDVGLPSLDDEMALWGDAGADAVATRLAGLGVRSGALKQGAAGPRPLEPDCGAIVAAPVGAPVDTTAAGDSFNGAYLAALLAGAAPADRLRAGHDLAVRVIGFPGAIIPR